MKGKGHNIIVIGTSAGGLEALDTLLSRLPTDLPAAIFIVQHLSPENSGIALLHRLGNTNLFIVPLQTMENDSKPAEFTSVLPIITFWSRRTTFW